ncbi:hypothetical protein [Phenylobacterium sp. SCN 70-31]|uniref:hypothetical protein n=1 Tax=Phenylobacterium sp. SCN 70-31 TaxID=1660129 RepID=UPI00086CA1C3|nr:hypothetical protein [Phenylobacterium sp. SCN 70-31]ODT84845.1 MAG: hypothetical protein ABS78_22065 [Phenylobacterium sp. SCN 70-31]
MTDYGPRYIFEPGRGYLDARPVMSEIGHYLTEEEVQHRIALQNGIQPPEHWTQWDLLRRQPRLGDWFYDGRYGVLRGEGPEYIDPMFPEHWTEYTKEERMRYLAGDCDD